MRKYANVNTQYCVACGCCAKACPVGAIQVYNGIYAQVNKDKCVGCTKCSKVCPADIIEMRDRI